MTRLAAQLEHLRRGERGSAVVEFVILAVAIFVPLTYGVIAFAAIQRAVFASTEAARQAGRAYGTAPDPAGAGARAEYAAALAVESQGIDPTDVAVWAAPASASCEDSGDRYSPSFAPAEQFVVCVQVTIRVPLIPEFITTNTSTGRYVVTMDHFR
ncbi:hypothetical protein EK0264_04355 [Epidermidibacterium keratini]|uniref:Pilus assembly protein n=1 Tax=Epidermidibacterium keratini TaxID=1891644 RepID=A0A7L4YKJ9_9ACTN|nr:hypothetical protein [Epidermidibacterium keratini]QHB99591.1 hypothetical protein EK0264_04355 [Epidermidibacterium keratini]